MKVEPQSPETCPKCGATAEYTTEKHIDYECDSIVYLQMDGAFEQGVNCKRLAPLQAVEKAARKYRDAEEYLRRLQWTGGFCSHQVIEVEERRADLDAALAAISGGEG